MNKYLKTFILRGLIFGGFGPITLGIVLSCIELGGVEVSLSGANILMSTVSTYVIAFVQAGSSIFNQIDHWSISKSLACHFSALFTVYSLAYVLNSWIPFEPLAILFFCLVFVLVYFAIWLTVYFSVKASTRRLNAKISEE